MPESFEFLRAILGVIGLGCAYMAGRALVAVRKGWQKLSKLYGWLIRAVVCLGAIVARHPVDQIAIAMWGMAVAAFGVAYWQMSRTRPAEDLTEQIFPHEQ